MNNMNWESIGLFPIPLFKIKVNGIEHCKRYFYQHIHQQSQVAENIEGLANTNPLNHYGNSVSVFNQFPELRDIRRQIEEGGSFVYNELMHYKKSGKMNTVNAWFNLAELGASQGAHTHANCRLCGTLYLHTDDYSTIHFYHPQTTSSGHAELYDHPDGDSKNDYGLTYHHPQVAVKVNVGDCLFWPPYLKHGYENNKTPERLSLSFNLMPSHLNTIYQVC